MLVVRVWCELLQCLIPKLIYSLRSQSCLLLDKQAFNNLRLLHVWAASCHSKKCFSKQLNLQGKIDVSE